MPVEPLGFLIGEGIFSKAFSGHKNIITSDVLKYYVVPDKYYIEVSKGVFLNTLIYGVTVLPLDCDITSELHYNLSKSFTSMEDVLDYINSL